MKRIAAAFCVLTIGLPGYLPLPYIERSVPAIDGRVSDANGDPVRKLVVKRVTNFNADEGRACEQDGDTTQTDAAGHFHFRSSWRVLPVVPLYGDPEWQALVCMPNDKTAVPVWRGGRMGRTPARIALECRAQREVNPGGVQCQVAPDQQ